MKKDYRAFHCSACETDLLCLAGKGYNYSVFVWVTLSVCRVNAGRSEKLYPAEVG